ncbi:SEC-C metal-binding domain-containing protein [Paenibacillus antri]|uniref:SEC-C metal-binding domain-containing protein n=1 Tax=Paenibacillus antri TaxID=2582848 RepID=UPI001EE3BE04|nr:SEC-C metal-binding domain-containing protein [Paenibacillus antri]
MSLKALDERMQEGYKLSMEGDTLGACDVWMQVWEGIEREMDARQIATVDRFDPVFDGEQSIENWAPRFEMELHNAILDDREYARMCVDFCSAYLARMANPNDQDGLHMRRAIAEARFKLGDYREGEAIFRTLTEEHPTWAWGWIGWAEQYGSFGEKEVRDAVRGADVLLRALAVEGLEERTVVMERLQDLYLEAGLTKEAEAVGKAMQRLQGASAPAAAKAGRNDPCPCGSGKKYKKCCGA